MADIIARGMAANALTGAKSYVDNKLGAITGDFNYLGSVATLDDLPTDANVGDEYTVGDLGAYVWNGTEWVVVGQRGAKGDTGDTGERGEQGIPGRDGYVQYTAGEGISIDNNTLGVNFNLVATNNYVDEKTVNKVNISDIQNNVTSSDTDKPLSANMGKELAGEINNLKMIGRFLAIWNCTTGLPTSDPLELPYEYKTGDYYRVGVVDETTNYMPDGDEYDGTASITEFTGEGLAVGAVFYYDGTVWRLQAAGAGGTVQDVQIAGTSILSGGIANIPIATSTNAGLVKSSHAISVDSSGAMAAQVLSYAQYVSSGIYDFISKGTLENVITGKAIKSTWTGTQAEYEELGTYEDGVDYRIIE